MPFITDTQALESSFIKRTAKLLPCQKEMVIWWRENKGLSYMQLARMFKVSKRTIQFIISPDKHIENLKRRKERGGSKQYYVKEKHTAAIREHRQYKYKILPHETNTPHKPVPKHKED